MKNPELVKRLERIKRKQEQKEYDKMVYNVDNSVRLSCIILYVHVYSNVHAYSSSSLQKQLLEKTRLGLEGMATTNIVTVFIIVLIILTPVQATSRQLWVVINFLLTVIGAFVFGFCAAGAVGFDLPGVSVVLHLYHNTFSVSLSLSPVSLLYVAVWLLRTII